MNTQKRSAISFTAMVAALLAAAGSAVAEDDEVAALTRPESTADVGVGYVSRDNQRFGQYTGLREDQVYGLANMEWVNRVEATGTWSKLTGRNLGFSDRELRFEHNRQGDWGYFVEYGQTPRYEPYTANTAVGGIGSANLSVPATATSGNPVQLKTEREIAGLGFDKIWSGGLNAQVRFRNEEKDGARLFARGTTGGAGLFQFTPEPINSTTRQLEATVGYTDEKLQLSGGYYGSWYNNHFTALNIAETGGTTGLSGFTPIGLPPDNDSHQLFLSGGYTFAPVTRGTFKLAYSRASQNDTFIVPSLPGDSGLNGRVSTTLAQFGLTAQPVSKLSLLANLRYENRDDETPERLYSSLATGTSTFDGKYEPRSIKTTAGKLEASYPLPLDLRLTGGVDREVKERSISRVRVVSAREETDETSYRLELRRSLSETVTGAVSYVRSERTGSDFLTTVLNNGTAGSNLIAPVYLADRDRDKVRLSVNWAPTEPLSFQLMADYARDEYGAPRTAQQLGPRSGKAQLYSLDASYAFSEAWQGSAWISRNDNRLDQATCVAATGSPSACPNTTGSPIWQAKLRNLGDAVGLGLRNNPTAKIEVGADLQYSKIQDEFKQQAITSGATVNSLPDINTRLTSVKLFTKYALQRNAGVRVDYIFDRFHTDDWTWTTWTYTDGTRLTQEPTQTVHFVGVSYYYRWQ